MRWLTIVLMLPLSLGCVDESEPPTENEAALPTGYADGKADHVGAPGLATVHGWTEGSPAAERILDVANGRSTGTLIELDYATWFRIDEYRRRFGTYASLAELDRISGVGPRAFQALWAWGEKNDWTYDAPAKTAYDAERLDNIFNPNVCVGEPLTVAEAEALLGDDETVVLGTAPWATEYQACFSDDGHCRLQRIRDDGDSIHGVLTLNRSSSGPVLRIDYEQAFDTDTQEECRVGAECLWWTVTPHCVKFAERSWLTALSNGDRTLTTQGFYFHLDAPPRETDQATQQSGAVDSDRDAEYILAAANTLPETALDLLVGLTSPAARNIAEYRDGLDGVAGTVDDRKFRTLDELDALPQIGPRSLEKLLEYARSTDLRVAGTQPGAASGPDLPLQGVFDPVQCTGPLLDDAKARALLGGRQKATVALGTVHHRATTCAEDGTCEPPEVRELGSATLELYSDDVAGIVATMRVDARTGRHRPVASCGLGATSCYDWRVELREGCARFTITDGSAGIGGSGHVADWVVSFPAYR